MKSLNARFRSTGGGGWEVRLEPEGGDARPWRPWKEPQNTDRLIWTLLRYESDEDLLATPWRLRLQPDTLVPDPGPMPPARWTWLMHPSGSHLLDTGWTVAELTFPPERLDTNGVVAVVDDAALANLLRKRLGPDVVACGKNEIPTSAFVVVPGRMGEGDAQELQQLAHARRCPVVIWFQTEPPRSPLVEVIPVGSSAEPWLAWVVRFLARARSGLDPEHAFAQAGLDSPPSDRHARWLRGACREWKVTAPAGLLSLPSNWFIRLDRSRQQSELTDYVGHLVLRHAHRRVQVVVVPGPEGAGLDLFRQRPLLFSEDRPEIITWDLDWSDEPSYQIRKLWGRARARDDRDLAKSLVDLAAQRADPTLFWVRHEIVSLSATQHLRSVSREDLESYLEALKRLALSLANTSVRVLVVLPVQTTSPDLLAPLRYLDRHCKCDILSPLTPGVPGDELAKWLQNAGLQYEPADVEEMVGLGYDDLILQLIHRYHELLK